MGKYVIDDDDDDDDAQRCIYMCGIVALKHCADFFLSSQVVQLQFKVGRPNFSLASIPSKKMCQYVRKVILAQETFWDSFLTVLLNITIVHAVMKIAVLMKCK